MKGLLNQRSTWKEKVSAYTALIQVRHSTLAFQQLFAVPTCFGSHRILIYVAFKFCLLQLMIKSWILGLHLILFVATVERIVYFCRNLIIVRLSALTINVPSLKSTSFFQLCSICDYMFSTALSV